MVRLLDKDRKMRRVARGLHLLRFRIEEQKPVAHLAERGIEPLEVAQFVLAFGTAEIRGS